MTTLGEEARPLVAELATARLLVTSSEQGIETVEVAHEALIRHWERSQGWVNNARGFLTWRKRLEPFVDEWQNRDRTALLRGGLLAEAQRWLAERRQDLDAPEREFIEASLRQQEREEAEAGTAGRKQVPGPTCPSPLPLGPASLRGNASLRGGRCVAVNGNPWFRPTKAAVAKSRTKPRLLRNLFVEPSVAQSAATGQVPREKCD